ncbi:hypothetical protein MKK55_08640 [Methylobacterium sp. J-059]|uniref:hypothetical protein n=1 Tax=Methylobacterium sp. J-059 TaxID=2836643 RepID=UPI001FB88BFD|nr:hypothetical protein [Methylobacterium sp. J-059]MCJ2039020.1 hypothetical protein [Methylobacterium sp. J-059]
MTETTLSFDACSAAGADADTCRAGIVPLLAPGMDWSEVHCGRCGKTGIVRHADLLPVPAPAPVPEVEATPEPEPDEPRTSKGGKA